jgi:hypothetical protein
MTTFNEALAAHGSAEEAIRHTLKDVYKYAHGNMTESFGPVAQWVLDNAPAIHAHQSGKASWEPNLKTAILELGSSQYLLSKRVQALEDAPGPRADKEELSALRQRMDGLTDTLKKIQAIDTSDVLTALVRDVAFLKDDRILRTTDSTSLWQCAEFTRAVFGTVPQTPEARKMLGLDVEPEPVVEPEPEPEPVYEWVGNDYYFDGGAIGGICQIFTGRWAAFAHRGCVIQSCEDTEAEARAWVEAQFNTPKP